MKISKVIVITILLLMAIIWITPVYVMINISLKPLAEINAGKYITPPTHADFENWVLAFESLKLNLLNSLIVSVPTTLIVVFLGSWSGYALAMFKFPLSSKLFFIVAIPTFLPYQIFLIPLVRLTVDMGLFNNFLGMMLAYTILNLPMAILITSLFFQTLPRELQEAAALDGCTPIKFYFKILFPLSFPGLASTAVLTFTSVWNEFIVALSLSRDPTTRLAIPTLAGLKGSYIAQWNVLMAGAALVSIPGILILIFLGKFFVKGLVAGAVKE